MPHLDHTLVPQVTSVPRLSIFPGPGHHRFSSNLWHGVSVHSVWIEECSDVAATRTHLSPSCLVASQHLHTLHKWSLRISSFSTYPSDSTSSQEGLSPMHRSPGLGHPVCGLTHSLSRVSVHPCNLPFPLSPLPGA